MDLIHPTAVIHSEARLDRGVSVGPYSVIEENARIGENTRILDRVTIARNTAIGKNNVIYTGAVLGREAQHREAATGETFLVIGDGNVIREYVTIHRGLLDAERTTVVGNRNYFMAFSHVGHDCRVEDDITLANAVLAAGHVTIQTGAVVSGGVVIHQYSRVGRYAMIGGLARIPRDVPPYLLVDDGADAVRSVNLVGLKRAHFSEAAVREIKKAYRLLYLSGLRLEEALEAILKECPGAEAKYLVDFIRNSKRGILSHVREAQNPEGELKPSSAEE